MIAPLLHDPIDILALCLMGGGAAVLMLYGVAMVVLNIWAAVSLAKEWRR